MSEADIRTCQGHVLAVLGVDGPPIAGEAEFGEIIAVVFGTGVDFVVIPVARFDPEIFTLSNGRLGGLMQKFVNYSLGFGVVGDIGPFLDKSSAFRDFVRETAQRLDVVFADDMDAFETQLEGRGA